MKEFNKTHKSELGDLDWKHIIKKCDTDKDGQISYEEFFTAASDRTKVLNKQYLRQAFNILDLDGDGTIDAQEMRACFAKGKLGEFKEQGIELEQGFFDKIIKSIDINNDGQVSFDEFELHMMKMVENLINGDPKPTLM